MNESPDETLGTGKLSLLMFVLRRQIFCLEKIEMCSQQRKNNEKYP